MLKDLKGDEKIKEEKEHHQLAGESKGYIDFIVLLDAGETVIHLQICLKVIVRAKAHGALNLDDEILSTSNKKAQSGMKCEMKDTNLKVSLSKLYLPIFDDM